jgi:hypothetical protein
LGASKQQSIKLITAAATTNQSFHCDRYTAVNALLTIPNTRFSSLKADRIKALDLT